MTNEEKLDFILNEAKEIKTFFGDSDMAMRIVKRISPEIISFHDMTFILIHLKEDGALLFNASGYKITFKGESILTGGGYVTAMQLQIEKELKENQMYLDTAESLAIAKKNYGWAVVAAVAAIVGVLLTVVLYIIGQK